MDRPRASCVATSDPFAAQRLNKNSGRSLTAIRHRNNVKVRFGKDGTEAIANGIGDLLGAQRFFEFVRSDEDLHQWENFFDAAGAKKIK